MTATGPVHCRGEVLTVKRSGLHHHVTLVAPGVPERFRPGNLVALTVGGPMSERVTRACYPVHRARATGAYGGTVELVVTAVDDASRWLVGLGAGTVLDVVGPLGRPFAIPKEPVSCLLVGDGAWSAPLFGLAERLKGRGCTVHMLLGGESEPHLFGALEARRATRSVTVATADGSVGSRGSVVDALPGLLERTNADVVYASARADLLHLVAATAERHGAWSQTLLNPVDVAMPCGTGICGACVVPAVGEDGVTRMVRACAEGPVLRGDRVRWADVGGVPEGAR
jgi:dihydroorotate dehydrogenase electron transfer subunit